MKTLIIHPKDFTTDFLKPIYEGISETTLVTQNLSKAKLLKMIINHDRVLLMGHGTQSGLLSVGVFPSDNGFIVDSSFIPVLKKKKNSMFIWCNADQFVEKYYLKGFFTGMFISEVKEAIFCGVNSVTQKDINLSNHAFASVLSNVVYQTRQMDYKYIKNEYGKLAHRNQVVAYNVARLYYK